MNKEDTIKSAVEIIRRYLPCGQFEVVLFGSWAKGGAHETSDIDIGIMGPEPADDLLMWSIREAIRSIPTLRRIDVVDLRRADEGFRREVLSYAQRL